MGQRLRQERLRQGLSQRELAVEGVSASYVSLLESGRREPTNEVVGRLAARLGIDAHVLLHGVDQVQVHRNQMDLSFARLCLEQGDAAEAAAVLARLLATGGAGLDRGRHYDARLAQALAHERLGELDVAVRSLEALRQEALRAPEELPWIPTVTALSRCYREAGDLHRAVDVAEEAIAHCDRLGLTGLDGHAQLVATAAAAYFDRGDVTRAAAVLDELIEATRGSDRQSRAAAYWNAALVAAEIGRHAEAAQLSERAAGLLAEGGDERSVARLKMTRAWIMLADDPPRPTAARELLRSALPVLVQHDSAGAVASAEVELARCELHLGRPTQARALATQALSRLGAEQPLEIARARAVLGEVGLHLGDSAARDDLDAAAALLETIGADRQAAGLWRRIAEARGQAGDSVGAAVAYRLALDAAGVRSSGLPVATALSPTSGTTMGQR